MFASPEVPTVDFTCVRTPAALHACTCVAQANCVRCNMICDLEDLQVCQHNAKLFGVTMATSLSAEPGRKAPYSNDLRWHIVWQKAGMELSF